MKTGKSLRYIILALCVTLCAILLIGCTPSDIPDIETNTEADSDATVTELSTDTDTQTGTVPATDADTEPATEADTLWSPDMGKFNDGNVVYVKTVETERVAEYPDALVGEPMESGKTGVVTLFSTDFDSDDITCDGKTALRVGGSAKVVDGIFYMSYDANSADHCAADGWTTYSVVTPASVKAYK